MHIVPVTAAIEKGGKFLLVKRSESEANFPGKWMFPGGKVEKGEDALQGLIREIKEETGIEIEDKIALLRTYHFTRSDGGNALGFNFVVQWKAGEVVLGDGLIDYAWILPEEIAKYNTIKGFEIMVNSAKEIIEKGLLFPISRMSHGANKK
ncbi:MAG TPA: NUDIX domain-containing protein [archaeon]|nr:NUDIX domain-containing protein [archaeon]